MATLNQFYQGELISVTAKAADGGSLTDPVMLFHLTGLDLTDTANASKVVEVSSFSDTANGYVFSLSPTTTLAMDAGDYTAELYFGTSSDRTIVRADQAFTLVESGFALRSRAGE